MRKILVTGGAGYVGSVLCERLLEEKDTTVTVLDRFVYGAQPITYLTSVPNADRFKCVKGDVRDKELVNKLVSQHDVILHLAAVVGFPACAADPFLATETNVMGSRNVAEAVSNGQIFVYASTGSTYGLVDGVCTEETPISPLSHYGFTKAEAEKMCQNSGAACLRFATIFGASPCMRFDLLVNSFVYSAIHKRYLVIYEGAHKRTFLHVRDAAESYVRAIDNYGITKGNIYNVGANELNFTKRQVADSVATQFPMYIHEASVGKDADCRNYKVDYSRFAALGFNAKVKLSDGIREIGEVAKLVENANPWRVE